MYLLFIYKRVKKYFNDNLYTQVLGAYILVKQNNASLK